MTIRMHRLLLTTAVVLAYGSLGASYQTQNFTVQVDHATPQDVQRVGEWAEYYRKEKAREWLGREMPPWSTPCPLKIHVTQGGAGGATTFSFSPAGVSQTMEIEGPWERLIHSVLPHEITHTVLAHYFGAPVPRWADEGSAVLSEDDIERHRHDELVRQILRSGRGIPLERLFLLKEYPRNPADVGALYAQGYSVSDYLVRLRDRKTFLEFISHGMQHGWDNAARNMYRFQSVQQLQQSWIASLSVPRQPQGGAPTILASNDGATPTDPAGRRAAGFLRLTDTHGSQGRDGAQPVIRGQVPDGDGQSGVAAGRGAGRPGYLPDPNSTQQPLAISRDGWNSPGVRLGAPQYPNSGPDASQAPKTRQPIPGSGSPIGYPGQ